MQFWKSLAIGLAVLLGISYVGFAYVYSQGGGIMIAGMVTGGMQPKVVTLLRNSNITLQGWNISVETLGYKTGFLYCYVTDVQPAGSVGVQCKFEVDEILGPSVTLITSFSSGSRSSEINFEGTTVWIWLSGYAYYALPRSIYPTSAVVSMSLYLRD